MDRRNFIRGVTVAGTAGLNLAQAAAPKETSHVEYKVKGFSCVTCAVGLEVMLRREKGVTRANATYPEGKVAIGYDHNLTAEKDLKKVIADCGFSVV